MADPGTPGRAPEPVPAGAPDRQPPPGAPAGGAVTGEVPASYASAIHAVATAEGVLARVEGELFTFAQTLERNPELRDRLADPLVGVAMKLEILDSLLAGRAHPQTVSAIVWIVQAGRVRQLTEIARALSQRAASDRNRTVAEVRSAVDLTAAQRERLAQALARTTGQQIETKVIVDPDVVGGLVVNLGDTVIDGSVARRLAELRARLVGA